MELEERVRRDPQYEGIEALARGEHQRQFERRERPTVSCITSVSSRRVMAGGSIAADGRRC